MNVGTEGHEDIGNPDKRVILVSGFQGLYGDIFPIVKMLAIGYEPVIIPKQTPFWSNDWRKKHKRK